MRIKRKFDLEINTKRQYIIRQSQSGKQIACSECGEPMLTTEQAAVLLGIKQRHIFQIIETKTAHFIESEAGTVMICPMSLTTVLDSRAGKSNQIERPPKPHTQNK